MNRNINTNTTNGGIGLSTVLFLIFLVLKLVGVIDWSWWWVTSPLWINTGIVLLIIIGAVIYCYAEDAIANRRVKKSKRGNKNGKD